MKRLACIGMLLLATPFGVAVADAELTRHENLLLAFDGRIRPHALPRNRDAPIRVRLDGRVRTTDGARPPQLRRISIDVNRYGRLYTAGLPTCRPGLLESTGPRQAMARCGSALVGKGRFGARLEFPQETPFPADGSMLAFNGRANGRPAIFLHIHGAQPVRVTIVLKFEVRHRRRGKFGTVFTAKIPRIASDLGYVTDVTLDFGRRYRHRGQRRSFLSARCAAPSGFPGALFSFARGTFHFAGGKRLTSTLARDCLVR